VPRTAVPFDQSGIHKEPQRKYDGGAQESDDPRVAVGPSVSSACVRGRAQRRNVRACDTFRARKSRQALPIREWIPWTQAFAFFQYLLNLVLRLMVCCALRSAFSCRLKLLSGIRNVPPESVVKRLMLRSMPVAPTTTVGRTLYEFG